MQNLSFAIIGSIIMAVSAPSPSSIEQGRAANMAVQGMPTNTLEMARNLIKQKKPYEAIQDLAYYKPSQNERSAYHYIYAQALVQAKKLYASIEHYRLAYIFAVSDADREQLLLERADVYAQMGYYAEAAVCLDVFL
ncbi:MAG: hypothetical protein HGB21_09700, partial [Nitrospirae bacterium]|nr:hypothetical protein [Nitrospirota bacterium]